MEKSELGVYEEQTRGVFGRSLKNREGEGFRE